MPDIYFSRPCPHCGGKVHRPDNADYAECTACHKRFRLTQPSEKPTGRALPEKDAAEEKRTPFSALLSSIGSLFHAVKAKCAALYRTLYKKIRKKNDRIPLPKPHEDRRAKHSPAPPMNEGQRALYNARKRQLEAREEGHVPAPAPTRGERIERFVTAHRRLSIALSIVALVLLLSLLTVGITFCVKESRINKDDFKLIYGVEGLNAVTGKETYKFITENGKTMKINMNAIASLCDLTISGTRNEPRYAVRGGTSYVKFKSGSRVATVNGKNYEMDCPAEYDDSGDLWVDLYFADDILAGVTVTVDRETNTISVTRNTTPEGTVLSPVYEAVYISAGNRTETEGGGSVSLDLTYKTDVSAYTADLYVTDPSYLLLANKQHPLGKDHAPSDLVEVTVPATRMMELRASAARALEAMFAEMAADGVTNVSITSAYRPYTYQEQLFSGYVEAEMAKGLSYEDAVALVETYSSRAGYSEHQTGLCVDFWASGMNDLTNEQFEPTEACKWLRENAWKFGFILRYPSDKTDTTGYSYESWHYRFVGIDAASAIVQHGWCLEEYLEKQN